MLRPGASPSFNLLYEVGQVKVAVEVKISGVVDKGLAITRQNFARAQAVGVKCCYVAFCDRKNAAATEEKLGFPCFNLTWSVAGGRREDTSDWPRLLKFLRSAGGERGSLTTPQQN